MGIEGKKYQTYKVSITWMIGHILCFFFLFCFFSFHYFIFLALKGLTLSWSNNLTSHGMILNKSKPG